MAIIEALKSVNTQTFPELQNVKDGYSFLAPGEPGGFSAINSSKVTFVYPDAATLEIIFSSASNDFTTVGFILDAQAQGTVSNAEFRKGGALAYQLSGFDPFTLASLYADASTGLKTFPAALLDGDDTLNGSGFADVLFAFDGRDSVSGFGGDDQIDGGNDEDTLSGGDGNDSVNGGANGDDLAGDLGADRMTGGSGGDTFIFLIGDSTKKASGRDTITDYSGGEDLIDLSGIDAKKGGGDNGFKFIGGAEFHDKKGELRFAYGKKTGDSLVQGDVNGDGKADFAILVENVRKLKAVDFDL